MADAINNVFDGGQPPPQNEPSNDKLATLLASITNEDGKQKYDNVEKAIEALVHSQTYIPQIKSQLTEKEQELERVKAELAKREAVEDVVKRLAASKNQDADDPQLNVGLDEQTVQKLVEENLGRVLSQRDAQVAYQTNVSKVQDTLVQKFGDKAGEVVAARAAELGITPKDIEKMAGSNPVIALELFKAQGVQTPNPTTHGRNIPPVNDRVEELKRPEKSLLRGGSNKERAEFMKKIRDQVYAKHGITNN